MLSLKRENGPLEEILGTRQIVPGQSLRAFPPNASPGNLNPPVKPDFQVKPSFQAGYQPPVALAAALAAEEPIHAGSRLALYCAMLMMFLRFSMLHEMLAYVTGVNTYLLYAVGPPALLFCFLSGGVKRMMQNRCAVYCLLFTLWLVISTPFSSWKGDSVAMVIVYLRTNIVILPALAGMAANWLDVRRVLSMAALGGALSIVNGRLFMKEFGGRPGLAFGTVANPDDFAGHLILLLPFLVWIVLDSKRNFVFRIAALGFIGVGAYIILGTASRGALVAMIVAGLFFLFKATGRQRFGATAIMVAAGMIILATLPEATLHRMFTFSTTSKDRDMEASESQEMRQYLLGKSIEYSLKHPIFGVGPGQFSNFEGAESKSLGVLGAWHSTHNSYTQVSSECGLPAMLFYMAAIAYAFGMLSKLHKQSRQREENKDITILALCVMLSFVGYFTIILFLNFAYFFYMPALVGLACMICYAGRRELASRAAIAAEQPAQPAMPWMAPRRMPVPPLHARPALQK